MSETIDNNILEKATFGSILITVDSRENSMITEINEEKNAPNLFKKSRNIEWNRRMMDVGDYSISNSNGLICLIERKSLADYVASFHDGRYKAQLERMKQVREVSKCFLYYIVEGKFVGMDINIGNTPYKNIVASMRKHEIEDSIFYIRTTNKKDTMRNIRLLAEFFSSSSHGIIGSKEAMLISKPDSTISHITSIWRSSRIPLKAIAKIASTYTIVDWIKRREKTRHDRDSINEYNDIIGDDIMDSVSKDDNNIINEYNNTDCKKEIDILFHQKKVANNHKEINATLWDDNVCTKIQLSKLLSISDISILSSFPKISESSAEYLLIQDSLLNILTSDISYTIKGRKKEKMLETIRELANKKIIQ